MTTTTAPTTLTRPTAQRTALGDIFVGWTCPECGCRHRVTDNYSVSDHSFAGGQTATDAYQWEHATDDSLYYFGGRRTVCTHATPNGMVFA